MYYDIVKSVILEGDYILEEMTKKINTLWVKSQITDEQKEELTDLMLEHLDSETERPELMEMYKNLEKKFEEYKVEVNDRFKVLEEKLEVTPPEPVEPLEYEPWEPWDGISDKYQYGSKVTHKGFKWHSEFQGQNTWEPGTLGTETLWIKDGPVEG